MAEKTSVPEPNSEINKLVYVIRDDGSYGGWRTELLVEEIAGRGEGKFLLCKYCRGVLRDACLFEKDDKHGVACSLCIPIDVDEEIAQFNREIVNEKQVQCPLKKKGCDWTNELSELLHHLEECELFPVACPLGCRDEKGEVSRVERRRVETHRTCCPMRTVKCEYCSVSVKACDMNGHLEVCEEFPIPCPNKCSEEFLVKRKGKSIHLSLECPLQETECPYSQYGCEAKVLKRYLEQHEKEDLDTHMKLTVRNMQAEITMLLNDNLVLRDNHFKFQSSLKEEKESTRALEITVENTQTKVAEQEEEGERFKKDIQVKIVELEKDNKVFRKLIPKFSLESKCLECNFSEIRRKITGKESTYTDPFFVGLYKFQGQIQWVSEDDHVGIFLYIMKGEWDNILKWPVSYRYSQIITNQLNANHNFIWNNEVKNQDLQKFPECFSKPNTERNRGFGKAKFISHVDLLRVKYSNGNRMTLKISVELIPNP